MPDALPKDRGNPDLAIALTYYSPYVSGLTNMARDLAEGLAARGRTVTVVTSHFDSRWTRRSTASGCCAHRCSPGWGAA